VPRERHSGRQLLVAAGILLLGVIAFGAQQKLDDTHPYSLNNGVSIELTSDWQKTAAPSGAPPAALGPYAPPFHFSETLVAASDRRNALLELAVSDNPLMGHDSYWLDAQLHSPPGSGMSMTDFLFYLFLPPPRACLDHTLQVTANASRAPQTGDPSSQGDLQVFYPCAYSSSTSDFYSSQLSAGMMFQQKNDGPHAFPVVGDFQFAPMEQLDVSGLTFYVFEAQSQQSVDEDTLNRFKLPKDMQGAHADFFWAIGAESPFPFVRDEGRKDVPLIHVAYAGLAPGPNPNKRPEFMDLLHHIKYLKPTAPGPSSEPAAQPLSASPATSAEPSASPSSPAPAQDQASPAPDQAAPPAPSDQSSSAPSSDQPASQPAPPDAAAPPPNN
jgi:hypothetical protein